MRSFNVVSSSEKAVVVNDGSVRFFHVRWAGDRRTMRFGNPDRRRRRRGDSHEPHRRELVQRVRRTFAEVPGLQIGVTEAAGLFGICERTSAAVLRDLVAAGTVRALPNGLFAAS